MIKYVYNTCMLCDLTKIYQGQSFKKTIMIILSALVENMLEDTEVKTRVRKWQERHHNLQKEEKDQKDKQWSQHRNVFANTYIN